METERKDPEASEKPAAWPALGHPARPHSPPGQAALLQPGLPGAPGSHTHPRSSATPRLAQEQDGEGRAPTKEVLHACLQQEVTEEPRGGVGQSPPGRLGKTSSPAHSQTCS